MLVAGSGDTLQFKVTKRQDVGETSFTVKGLPEGVTGPSVVPLGASATSLLVPLSSVSTARHGDVVVTVESDAGFSATAKLVVRGTAGAPDTGFGTAGTLLVPGTSTALEIAGLADERIVVGTTESAKPRFFIVDAKGSSPAPPVLTSTLGNALVDVAPTTDGGFVALVKTATNELHLVWFSSDGAQRPASMKVSANATRPSRIAATPRGTLFAQGDGATKVTVKRYGIGQEDAGFAGAVIDADDSANVRFLAGTASGDAWVGFQQGIQQEALAHVGANGAVKTRSFLAQEACSVGGGMVDDVVARCTADGPTLTVRRFTFTADTVTPVNSFGDSGALTYGSSNGAVVSLLSPAADKLYVGTSPGATMLRIDARNGTGASRAVFAANGMLDVSSDDMPVMTLDARGRIVVAGHLTTTGANVSLRRYWD